jgi:preprotein translocase subunit SecA
MNDYSDNVLRETQDKVEKWCDAFSETDIFKNLPEAVQEEAWFITTAFSEQMYNYHLQTPEEWTANALGEVICDLFPRKIMAEENLFNSVEPVLTSFFQYLNDMGYIKNSSTLNKALKKAVPVMLKQSSNSSNWGPAKQFAMAAIKNGINLEDSDAIKRFMNTYNTGIKSTPATTAPKTGRNNPCPCNSGKKYKQCCGKNV